MKTFLMMLLGVVPMLAQDTNIEQPSGFSATPAGGKFLHWYGKLGRTYFPQNSSQAEPLYKWEWAPVIETGKNETISHQITSAAPRGFFRLQYTDLPIPAGKTADTADFDNDDLKNYVEITNIPQTDPLNPDTDTDGMPDGWEIAHRLNANDSSDANSPFPGNNNMTNLQAFQSGVVGNPNATPTDRDGDSVEDHEDSDPNDRYVDWPPAAEGSYAAIQIGSLANSGYQEIMMNTSGAVFHYNSVAAVPPSNLRTETARIWINGTWSSNISATFTLNIHEDSNRDHYSEQVTTCPSHLSGNYLYRTTRTFIDHGGRNDVSTFSWNATSLSIPAHDSFVDLGRSSTPDYESGTGYDVDPLYYPHINYGNYPHPYSDGAITRLQIRDRSGSPLEQPIACVWFPPSYVSEYGTPSLQLPAGYGISTMDGSGAVIASKYANGFTTYTLFDQGSQTPLPNEIAGSQALGRITFGANNEHSRLLIGSKAVKSNGAIHMRQVIPFAGNGWVTHIAGNGILLGNERIDPNASATRPAIWRNGRSVPLTDLINPQPTSPRYSNIGVHDMNDSGLMVATAADTENTNADSKSLLLLLPVEAVSRDKFLAGSFRIPSGWDSVEMEFVGPDGSLGKYGNLLGGGTTKIYDKVEDILADSDYAASGQDDTQRVWFVRDLTDARKINYYICFDSTGDVQIKLYLNGGAESIGGITHTLTAAEDFAAVIEYVDEWVKGTSFDFTGGIITPPLAMRSMSMNAAGGSGIHNLTRAALIPFFNVVSSVEGLGSVAFGLFDGIKEGVGDDYKLLVLIKSGVLGAGGWAIQSAEEELNKWKNDPLKRAAELKKAADRLCQEWVFKPMEQVQADLSTWEGWKKRSWRTWNSVKGTTDKVWVLTKNSWGSIKTGLADWANDFANRMMVGAEKNHWSESVLSMDKIQGDISEYTRQASYTFGYTFGYISEQVTVGILTGATIKIGAVMTKGGAALSAQLAARRVLPVVGRLQFVKKWAASTAISIEMKAAVERGLIIAAETPLSLAVKDSAAEVIERGMARATYQRSTFSSERALGEILNLAYLKQLIATPGLEGNVWKSMAEWFHLLRDDATASATKGWVKTYNRSLKFEEQILLDDRMPDLYILAKAETTQGKQALKKSLEEFGATDGNGKFWLRDLHTVYEDMYHHLGSDFFGRLRIRNGNVYLSEFTGDRGWYVTANKLDSPELAKDLLQLPSLENARFRCKFKVLQAKDNLKAARGVQNTGEYFEFVAKDHPQFGPNGGGTQLLLDNKEVLLDEVFDTLEQRVLTLQEIQNLGAL